MKLNSARVFKVTLSFGAGFSLLCLLLIFFPVVQAYDLLPWERNPWEHVDHSGRAVIGISHIARDRNMFVHMDQLPLPVVPQSCLDPFVVAAFSEDVDEVGSRLAKYRMVARWHLVRKKACEVIQNSLQLGFQDADPAISALCAHYVPGLAAPSLVQVVTASQNRLVNQLETNTLQHLAVQTSCHDGQYNPSLWGSTRVGSGQQTLQPNELPVFRVDLPSVAGLPFAPAGRLMTNSLNQVRIFGNRALERDVAQLVRRGACDAMSTSFLLRQGWQQDRPYIVVSPMVDSILENDYRRAAALAPAAGFSRQELKDKYRSFLSSMMRRTHWRAMDSCVREVTEGPDGILFGLVGHSFPIQCRLSLSTGPLRHSPENSCELTYESHLGSSTMSQARNTSPVRVKSVALVATKNFGLPGSHRIEVRSSHFKVTKIEPAPVLPERDLQVSFVGSKSAILEYSFNLFQSQCRARR